MDQKITFVKMARGAGVFAGVVCIAGAVIEIPYSYWQLAAFAMGILFVLPWSKIVRNSQWWVAYIALLALVILTAVVQAKALIVFTKTRPLENIFWITIETLQPLAIWMMKNTPNQRLESAGDPPRGPSAPQM